MKTCVKLLIFLILFFGYSNAYSPHNPTECSLSRYESNNTKCVKLVYDEVNERLDRAYNNILKNIPRADTIEVIQEYTSLLKTKNEVCSKNPKNIIGASCETGEYLILNDETELDCRIVKSDFCGFYKHHGYISKKISENNASTIKKQYNSWLKSRNEFCKQYSNDEIKLKSCHIDYSIPKLNELWEMKSILLEKPFEGKWADCGYDRGSLICGTYFVVEQGDNVCSGDWIDPNNRYISIELYGKNANYILPFKLCFRGNTSCDILEDGYDEQGRKTYQTNIPFSEWEDDDSDSWQLVQYYYKKPSLITSIKTPFLPNEKEELIQTNKWLKDCLNYKGKQYE
jgi:uncharacterized protein YecT (DUF1311 family)